MGALGRSSRLNAVADTVFIASEVVRLKIIEEALNVLDMKLTKCFENAGKMEYVWVLFLQVLLSHYMSL